MTTPAVRTETPCLHDAVPLACDLGRSHKRPADTVPEDRHEHPNRTHCPGVGRGATGACGLKPLLSWTSSVAHERRHWGSWHRLLAY